MAFVPTKAGPSSGAAASQAEKQSIKTTVAEAEFDRGNTFQLHDEDHTLANALRFMLNKK